VNLLSDFPLSGDEIGGAHGKVASAIFDLISTEKGGKVIGLEGKWGSGKSTIIEILSNLFSKKKG
jgi:ABC-type Na+ transport system ATPase subunit NatA